MINEEYYRRLIELSKKHFKKNFDIERFNFDDFENINYFLIDKVLDKGMNLQINLPQRDIKRDFYIPTFISISSSLLFKNYVDDYTQYNCNDILQRNGLRYKYLKKNNDGTHSLLGKNNAYVSVSNKGLKKYLVTTAEITQRQVKTKFNDYKEFYKLLSNDEYVPSKFGYKAAIILEKKGFLDALKNHKGINGIDIKKAIPYKWVTKKGLVKKSSDNLPIEPMIYLLPDYESFKDFVYEEVDNLETVVFIGKNKYEAELTQIRKDLRLKKIKQAIFIGSSQLESINDTNIWSWTSSEIAFFDNQRTANITVTEIKNESLQVNLDIFENKINVLDEEFCFNLKSLFRLKKILYSTVFPFAHSRLAKQQVEYISRIYRKEIAENVEDAFCDIDEDPTDTIKELSILSESIIAQITNVKFKHIERTKPDVLIVSDRFKDVWEEERPLFSYTIHKIKLLTPTEFVVFAKKSKSKLNVSVLTLFGFKETPFELLKKLNACSYNFEFILYPEEKELFLSLEARLQNETLKELKSKDRVQLSSLTYPEELIEENIEDIISKFSDKEFNESGLSKYDYSDGLEYEIEFESGDNMILDGHKSVLVQKGTIEKKYRVENLVEGDTIRVYANSSKEELFNIALEADSKGTFKDIQDASSLWRKCLFNYVESLIKQTGSLSDSVNLLYKQLLSNGLTVNINVVCDWINQNKFSEIWFPASPKNLMAIKKTIDCPDFNINFKSVKEHRRMYRSIMIALGRDFSDEVVDYIVSKGNEKGKILEKFDKKQISSIISTSAPQHRIKRIRIKETSDEE